MADSIQSLSTIQIHLSHSYEVPGDAKSLS